jgi:hypothetical protein
MSVTEETSWRFVFDFNTGYVALAVTADIRGQLNPLGAIRARFEFFLSRSAAQPNKTGHNRCDDEENQNHYSLVKSKTHSLTSDWIV